ncbi:MAG: threonine ammonia-lyase [bacterium]
MMITLNSIHAAATRLAPFINTTPLVESEELNARLEGRILLKIEALQKTGSFKFRGATNRIAQFTPDEKARGIVAWSSGNHAQGVALAAKLHQVPATIIMPTDAPRTKIERTRAADAQVILYDRTKQSREEIGMDIAAKANSIIIPPFDDPSIISGQGTVGLEIIQQCQSLGLTPDLFAAPCSGGGLTAGSSVALAALAPTTKIYTVEPEGFDDMKRSLQSGEVETNRRKAGSICDALMQPHPGELTLPILQKNNAAGLTANELDIKQAMRILFDEFRVVTEPSGAVPLAALLAGQVNVKNKVATLVISGGNVDPAYYRQLLEQTDPVAEPNPFL